jgi:stage II sporulation protein D
MASFSNKSIFLCKSISKSTLLIITNLCSEQIIPYAERNCNRKKNICLQKSGRERLSFFLAGAHIVKWRGLLMKEKIKTFCAICILILTVPYVVTLLFQGNETSVGNGEIQELLTENAAGSGTLGDSGMDLEEYLTGILAKEIPLDYEKEAIKAQAVIARTQAAAAMGTEEQNLPDSMSREEMLTLWGQEGFEANYRTIEEAVASTRGEILMYDGSPIQAAFHAVSAGKTRAAKEALQQEDKPYLSAVESGMDIPSPDFLKVVFMEKEELLKKLEGICPGVTEAGGEVLEKVSVLERDPSDYVLQMKIGEQTSTGEEFRECLGLNSACYYLKEVDNKIRIVSKGLGHGLGLSQYGANELAKEGKGYQEILQYYYKGVSIEKIDEK